MSKYTSGKLSVAQCMGIVDKLCCASLQHVNDEGEHGFSNNNNNNNNTENEKKEKLKSFFASYDLNFLNSNDSSSHSSSSPNTFSDVQLKDGGDFSRKDTYPMSNTHRKGDSSTSTSSTPSIPLLHTILPNSMLPQDYGMRSQEKERRDEWIKSDSPIMGDENSCCHSCPEILHQDNRHYEPHVFRTSDTFTTVASAQSYLWDDDEEENEEEVSMVDSVFRQQDCENIIPSTDQPVSQTASSLLSSKTHEAYQYLLRMTPQNYLHYGDDNDSNHLCGIFPYHNEEEDTNQVPTSVMPRLDI